MNFEKLESRVLMSASPIRINAGGKAFTDAAKNVWAADEYYSGGSVSTTNYNHNVGNALYDDRRYGAMTYTIPVAADGSYTVKLLMHDPLYTAAGKREFNVAINGKAVLTNFDLAANGASGTSGIIESFNTTASNGKVQIVFSKGKIENPIISGIEIDPATTTPAPDFTKITWTTRAAGPIIRAESLRASIDNKLYVFGGFNGNNGPVLRSDVYTPASNSWSQIADLPEKLTHSGVAVYGTNVYFLGGYVGDPEHIGFNQKWGTKDVWIYNSITNSFSAGPALPAAYAGGGAVIIGNTLHYFGGFDLSRKDLNIHLTLDLSNPKATWQTATPMLKTVNHMGYVNYGGKIYAIAGQTGHDANLVTQSSVQIFDPATNTWTYGANMPGARSHIASATFVMGDRILVLGGESADGVETSNCYAYTPATNTWQTLTSLPTAKFSGVADVFNGDIYFTSGGNSTTTYEGIPVLS